MTACSMYSGAGETTKALRPRTAHLLGSSKLVLPEVWGRGVMEKRNFKVRRVRPTAVGSTAGKKYPKSERPAREGGARGPYADYPCPHTEAEDLLVGTTHPSHITIRSAIPHPPRSKLQVALPLQLTSGTSNNTVSPGRSPGLKYLNSPREAAAVAVAIPGVAKAPAVAGAAGCTSPPPCADISDTAFLAEAFGMAAVATPGVNPRLADYIGKECQDAQYTADIDAFDQRQTRGFEQVWSSLEGLFARLKGDHSLSDSWVAVSGWLDKFYCDSDSSDLADICKETLRGQYETDAARGRRHPNPAMTALSLSVMDQIMALTERNQPKLTPVCSAVRREILGAVFVHVPSAPEVPDIHNTDADAKDVLQGAADQYKTKSFYSLTRELSNRMQQAETDIISEETKREKQLAVMDRVISYWQMEFQKLILKVWKLHFEKQKEEKARLEELRRSNSDNAELQSNIATLKQEVLALRNEHARLVTSLNERIQEKEAELVVLDDRANELDASNQELLERLASMQEATNNLYKQEVQLREDISSYQVVLENTVKCYIEGPRADVARQVHHQALLEGSDAENWASDSVTEWFITATEKEQKKDSASDVLSGIANVMVLPGKTLVPDFAVHYLRALRHLSPSAIVESDFNRIINDTPKNRLDYFFELAERCHITLPFTSEDACTTQRDESLAYHNQIMAALFSRFADSGLPGEWQRADTLSEKSPSPLWPTTPTTPEEWTLRVKDAWKRRVAWKELNTSVRSSALKVALATKRKK